jgi:hypothetical protein
MLKSADPKSDIWKVLRLRANLTMVRIVDTKSDQFCALFVRGWHGEGKSEGCVKRLPMVPSAGDKSNRDRDLIDKKLAR